MHGSKTRETWLSAHPGRAEAEFQALYERLHPPLWRYVHRMVGDGDIADDVVQEAFVRLLGRSDLEADAARLWVFTVATNLVRDRGRTVSRRARLLSAVPTAAPAEPPADDSLERKERVESVRRALAELSERDRQLLLMREEGFKYHEIAAAVGVAPGSVGTLIARAVRRFTDVYRPLEE
jgi:RNA polymerase sigma-70 factor, ECF subfamily